MSPDDMYVCSCGEDLLFGDAVTLQIVCFLSVCTTRRKWLPAMRCGRVGFSALPRYDRRSSTNICCTQRCLSQVLPRSFKESY